jgi:hypothetical protein
VQQLFGQQFGRTIVGCFPLAWHSASGSHPSLMLCGQQQFAVKALRVAIVQPFAVMSCKEGLRLIWASGKARSLVQVCQTKPTSSFALFACSSIFPTSHDCSPPAVFY